MSGKLLNAKLIMTVLLGIVYVGSLLWALLHGQLEIQSFTAGIGPAFGAAWNHWFSSQEPRA